MADQKVTFKLNLDGTKKENGSFKFKAGTKAIIKFSEKFNTTFHLSYETPEKIDIGLKGDWTIINTEDYNFDLSGSISTDMNGNYIFNGSAVMSFEKNLKVKVNPIYDTVKGIKIVIGLELVF